TARARERAAAADRNDRCEPVRELERQLPRAEAPHADTRDIDAILIDRLLAPNFVEHGIEELHGPDPILGHLRRDDHERQVGSGLADESERTVYGDALQLVAPLAGAVQEQQQRPATGGVVVGWLVDQVATGDVAGQACVESPGPDAEPDF